jgi:hypothetical protein
VGVINVRKAMNRPEITRRAMLKTILGGFGARWVSQDRGAYGAETELRLAPDIPEVKVDVETKGIEQWTVVEGR